MDAPSRQRPGTAAEGASTVNGRVEAPFGRRLCEVTRNVESGGYRIFSALDPTGPEPAAGQFYMLAAETRWGSMEERPYLARAFSVADAERQRSGVRLDFLVQAVGPGTERLAGLEAGEGLWITGPLGQPFSPPRRTRPRRGRRDPGRRRDRGRPAGDLAPAAARPGDPGPRPARLPRPRALRRPRPSSTAPRSGWRARTATAGHHGYVTDLLTVLLEGDDAGSAAVYACGPPAMLEAVRLLCAERGVACELAMEAPMACGFGACFGCAVPLADGGYMRLCVDGPVVRGEQIATALVPGSGH